MSQQISSLSAQYLMIIGAVVSWILFALICWVGGTKVAILACIMGLPSVLLLSYFAFGGDIPVKLQKKGWHRLMLFGIVGWASILAGIFVIHFAFAGTWPSP